MEAVVSQVGDVRPLRCCFFVLFCFVLFCFLLFCFISFSQAADLQIQMTKEPQKKPAPSQALLFGKTFIDHMLMVEWNNKAGWGPPRIQPFQNLTLHPACSGLHYSLQVGLAASVPTLLRESTLLFPDWVQPSGCFAHFFLCHLFLRSPVFWDTEEVTVSSCFVGTLL